MTKPLNLYVWEDVLTDHTSGMVVAVARSLPEAREAVRKTDKSAARNMFDHTPGPAEPDYIIPLNKDTKPAGFVVWGGG